MSLFLHSIPEASTPEQLDQLFVSYPDLSRDYITSAAAPERKKHLEKVWDLYKSYADEGFRAEFAEKGKLNKRAWEMYMGYFVLKSGLTLHKKTVAGPDLRTCCEGQVVWIECTAPDRGNVDGAPQHPEIKPGNIYTFGGNIEEINRPLVLRILGALRNKSLQNTASNFSKSRRSGVVSEKDCYIIAINGNEFDWHSSKLHLLRRALFGAGCDTLHRGGGYAGYIPQPSIAKLKSAEVGETISSSVFLDNTYPEVSAIIYSNDHIIHIPRDNKPAGLNLWLVRNPFAHNPLPESFPRTAHELLWVDGGIRHYVHH